MPLNHRTLCLPALIFVASKFHRPACLLSSRDIALGLKGDRSSLSEGPRSLGARDKESENFVHLDLKQPHLVESKSSLTARPNTLFEWDKVEASQPYQPFQGNPAHFDSMASYGSTVNRGKEVSPVNVNLELGLSPPGSWSWKGKPKKPKLTSDYFEHEDVSFFKQVSSPSRQSACIPEAQSFLPSLAECGETGNSHLGNANPFLTSIMGLRDTDSREKVRKGHENHSGVSPLATSSPDFQYRAGENILAVTATQNLGSASPVTETAGMMGLSDGLTQADPQKITSTLKVGNVKEGEDGMDISSFRSERIVPISPEPISRSDKKKTNFSLWIAKPPYSDKLAETWDYNMKQNNMQRGQRIPIKAKHIEEYSKILEGYPSCLYKPADISPSETKPGPSERKEKRRAVILTGKKRRLDLEEDLVHDIKFFFCRLKENLYECVYTSIQATNWDDHTKQITYGYSLNKKPSKGLKNLFPIERFEHRARKLAFTTISKVESIIMIIRQGSDLNALKRSVWEFFKSIVRDFIPFLFEQNKQTPGNRMNYSLNMYFSNWKEIAFESLVNMSAPQKETAILAISNYILIDWISINHKELYIAITSDGTSFQAFRRITSNYLVDKDAVIGHLSR